MPAGDSTILVAVNTDPYHTQWANFDLNLEALGVKPDQQFQVHDLLTEARYRWQGYHATVGLDPGSQPAHVFAVRKVGDGLKRTLTISFDAAAFQLFSKQEQLV